MKHERFHYRSLDDVRAELDKLSVSLPLSDNVSVLASPVTFGGHTLHNRLGIAPMEGADSLPDGSPSELTRQRYIRLAESGVAMIWTEAVAITPEGRSSPRQLLLNEQNLPEYARMISDIKEAGMKKNGFAPYIVMQANHSGRYSKPDGTPKPIIAYRHPIYEQTRPADDSCIASDDYLLRLEDTFGSAALLARAAGFDAVDIKSCHGYLLAELASAYTREGPYGGAFENRFRLLFNAVKNAKQVENESFSVIARIGIYDGFPYPYGFGVKPGEGITPDFTEGVRVIKTLHEQYGMPLVNVTMGNPYQNTHVTRPYDNGVYVPEEHPLEGVARMYEGVHAVKRACPGMTVSGSAPSYLRQFSANLAAGAVEQGFCDTVLFGRLSFAYPDFAKDILENGSLDPKRVCLTCGSCGVLIRSGNPTGCAVRFPDPYMKILKSLKK